MEELTFEQWHYKNYSSCTDDISDENYDERCIWNIWKAQLKTDCTN